MKEYHLVDKSEWGNGPWANEPDMVTWIDFDTFYPCIARRNTLGAWCGYVGLAPHHPLFRVIQGDPAFEFLSCHGGISYAGFGEEDSKQFTPPIRLWWIGFAAMQPEDMIPPINPESGTTKAGKGKKNSQSMLAYRDLEFIRNEVAMLADQLSNIDDKIVFSDVTFTEF